MSAPLLYSQCWEDPAVLAAALAPAPGARLLSVASAGDNSLALLLTDPAEVLAFDRNPTQLRVVELKIAALRALPRVEALELLGARPCARREDLLARVRSALPLQSRSFWDQPEPRGWLRRGLLFQGRFDRYLAGFREWVLPWVHSRPVVERLLRLDQPEEQRRFYDEVWDTRRWRGLFRLFFSRRVMAAKGRDPAFFQQVGEQPVAEAFLERARWALTALPVRSNPYVGLILAGEFREESWLPPYLQADTYEQVAARVGRVRLHEGELGDLLGALDAQSLNGFNLSDLFEYLGDDACLARYRGLARVGAAGARLCYWNLLVPRTRPPALDSLLEPEPERAAALHAQDRAFFYRRLVVERVTP